MALTVFLLAFHPVGRLVRAAGPGIVQYASPLPCASVRIPRCSGPIVRGDVGFPPFACGSLDSPVALSLRPSRTGLSVPLA